MQDRPDDVLVLDVVSVALRALEPQPREKEAHFARGLGGDWA
jgi:hypothetical protein